MTNVRLKVSGAVAAQPSAWSVPIRLSFRKPRLPVPSPSLRVPTTRENRERLRSLRATESLAWTISAAKTPSAALRAETASALRSESSEARLFVAVGAVAAVAVTMGLATSLDFVAHWQQFVNLIQLFVG